MLLNLYWLLGIIMRIYSYIQSLLSWSFDCSFQTEGVFLTASDHSVFSVFSHILIVIPLGIRWGVCSVQACGHTCKVRMRACLSNLIFLFVCVRSGREGMCLFSPVPSSVQPRQRSEQGENKRGARGGESAPTVDLAIVGGGTLFPLMLWTHGWNPQKL